MNIVYLTTEAVPLAKTGGLADVCGSLPIRVAQLGHQAAVVMPAFRSVYASGMEIETTNISFAVSLSPDRLVGCRVLTTKLPDSEVPVWMIDQPQYFDRPGLYGTPDGDYVDNAERFIFFCRAAMMTIERMGWSVDIVHCNDWQTGMVPALMKIQSDQWSWIRPDVASASKQSKKLSAAEGNGVAAHSDQIAKSRSGTSNSPATESSSKELAAGVAIATDRRIVGSISNGTGRDVSGQTSGKPSAAPEFLGGTKSIMTVHNLAYQGVFPKDHYPMLGVDWVHFNQDQFEYYDQLNFLKTGLMACDHITTVSPRYSHEIRTPQQGCGLDQVLGGMSDHITGIMNGIDRNIWNPKLDPHLFRSFDIDDWQEGKAINKLALQRQFGLEEKRDVPLIGLVGRLASQKGWDMIVPVLQRHLEESRPTQWIVLGSGEARYEKLLRELAEQFPGHFALHIGFSDALAHQVEAASDLFVMPSHYEPCGLNQLYSLRYGTVPIVTPTGGLADSVVDSSEEAIDLGTATGFHLAGSTADGLDAAIGRALEIRFHRPAVWQQIVTTGMSQDWSWRKSAQEYVDVYEKTLRANHAP